MNPDRREFLALGAGAAAMAVAGCATEKGGVEAIRTNKQEDPAVLAARRARLESGGKLGPTVTDLEVRTTRNIPGQRAAFYIDDVLFSLQDLARQKPKSLWDHFYFRGFREAHERYGLKAQMNLFYQGDFFYGVDSARFNLSQVPENYLEEFQSAKDWLRFGFHSFSEFPDYPWLNASYDEVRETWRLLTSEVERFAGPGMFAKAVVPHWGPVSKEGCLAFRDCGVKTIWCSSGDCYAYAGDRTLLPYMHGQRIEERRKPETAMYWRPNEGEDIAVSACGYNHLLPEQVELTNGTWKWLHDKSTGCNFMAFETVAPCLNLYALKDIPACMALAIDHSYLIHNTHEQYWFPRYFAYQEDSRQKLLSACKCVYQKNIPYIWIEDKIDWS